MPRLKGRPSLTKREVNAYFKQYYRSLYQKIDSYCYVRGMETREILHLFYLDRLTTRQAAPSFQLLSRNAAMYFVRAYYADQIKQRKNKFKKPIIYVPDYSKCDKPKENNILEQVELKQELELLRKKVKELKVPKRVVHYEAIYDYVPDERALKTFKDYIVKEKVKKRKVDWYHYNNLVKKLKALYGIQ